MKPSDLMEEDMKSMHFVKWDRYVETSDKVDLFGWIKREDSHEDFVLLTYSKKEGNNWDTCFSTSSKEYSAEIARILQSEHSDCKRVENDFMVRNCVRLKSDK